MRWAILEEKDIGCGMCRELKQCTYCISRGVAEKPRKEKEKNFLRLVLISLINRVMSESTTESPNVLSDTKKQNIEKLVIDTNAIVHGSALRHLAQEFYTCPEVLAEVRSAHSREYLERLPFELKVESPSEEAVKAGNFRCIHTTRQNVF